MRGVWATATELIVSTLGWGLQLLDDFLAKSNGWAKQIVAPKHANTNGKAFKEPLHD